MAAYGLAVAALTPAYSEPHRQLSHGVNEAKPASISSGVRSEAATRVARAVQLERNEVPVHSRAPEARLRANELVPRQKRVGSLLAQPPRAPLASTAHPRCSHTARS
eukprot:scaffold95313_cov81-Phaeocystis_antarctica.AAC.5